MLLPKIFILLCALSLLSACSVFNDVWMLAPGSFDMVEVHAQLYVEPGMTKTEQAGLEQQIKRGRAQVEKFYGKISVQPYFIACKTYACAIHFGSLGGRAAAFGDMAIRLAPDGLQAPLIAHELAHAELYRRIGGWWYVTRIPRWFDEGLATVIADEPLHSEANWLEIRRRDLPVPALAELTSYSNWGTALQKYGETNKNDPNNLRVVYTTAAHEIRGWLSCAGANAVTILLNTVHDGAAFASAYERLKGNCSR